jgi:hypothetical protein
MIASIPAVNCSLVARHGYQTEKDKQGNNAMDELGFAS